MYCILVCRTFAYWFEIDEHWWNFCCHLFLMERQTEFRWCPSIRFPLDLLVFVSIRADRICWDLHFLKWFAGRFIWHLKLNNITHLIFSSYTIFEYLFLPPVFVCLNMRYEWSTCSVVVKVGSKNLNICLKLFPCCHFSSVVDSDWICNMSFDMLWMIKERFTILKDEDLLKWIFFDLLTLGGGGSYPDGRVCPLPWFTYVSLAPILSN